MNANKANQHSVTPLETGFSLERAIRRSWFGTHQSRPLSLPEQIAVTLSVRILSLDLPPGERVIEQDIADEFQVSRGPIREAFRILEREELVIITARRGCIVTQLSSEEVSDIFQVRAALLAVVAQKLAEKRSRVALAVLDNMIAVLEPIVEQDDDHGRYAEAVFEHGLQLVEATESTTLIRMLSPLALRTLRYSLFGLRSQVRRQESISLWKAERNAIAAGDVREASEAAVTRILKSRDEALKWLSTQTAAF